MVEGKSALSPDEQARQVYIKAIKLLSRREHSQQELRLKLSASKLAASELSCSTIDVVLQRLVKEGYQCDKRFATLYAEQRSSKGYGPLSIRAKLAERGIEKSLRNQALEQLNVDWPALAASVLLRRFDQTQLADRSTKQRSRIARFLQSRGFSGRDSLRAVQQTIESVR